MGFTPPTEEVALANLVFFGITILPVCYCFYMHRLNGIGPWLNGLIWNTLRLAGNGIAYKALVTTGLPNIITPLVLDGCGLSPFVIMCLAFMKECNVSILKDLPWWVGHWGLLIAHVLLIVGHAVGMAGLARPILLKAGFIVWISGWLYTGLMLGGSWFSAASKRRLPGEQILLYAATIAWPLVGVRLIYVTYDGYTYGFYDQGSISVQAVCGLLPEFLCMTIYLIAGIWTRHLSLDHQRLRREARAAKKQGKDFRDNRNGSASSSTGPLDKYSSRPGSGDLQKPAVVESVTRTVEV
ncbi:hypothetical protein N7478_004435 [Penicillium angulare]|uniref:uncharacterized protein n=1 Tax=Penicillium angulare TaxID=116970 RepID=UPI002541BF3C|nr:uncharacterized protein N7478_004435 [Penicillium angulare]KAJ5279063.1 hypothetical protein N7478_004435 [Penicillium angulare]